MSISENIESLKQEISDSALKVGRNPNEIKFIAVSKTKPVKDILEAYRTGICDFGENRPQEIAEKFPHLPIGVRWHMIGHLQKNKVRHIIDKVSLIHSVDDIALAEEIEKRAAAINKIQDILLQVNISGEASKSGFSPEDVSDACRTISGMQHIRIKGLMTISVKGYSEEENRMLFSKLKELSDKIAEEKMENVFMDELSMGMSGDYKEAIETGATLIRVGTLIFGERDYII